jgi:mono/diheme cytochrome c family protein
MRFFKRLAGALGRAGRAVADLVRRVAVRFGRGSADAAAHALGITLGDLVKWTVMAVLGVIGLGVAGALFLIFYPETQIPEAEPIAETRYLDQGWGTGRESPQRETYYYTPQGASLRNLRYSWFVNLERPWGRRRLADPAHLRSLGFIVDPVPTPANPDQLPIGFGRRYDEALGDYALDITCAACHTGQINITRGGRTIGIRIDGGPAMHAFTAMDIGHFLPVLLGSMASTYVNPFKFNRFARRVLGDAYDEGKSRLSAEFRDVLMTLLAQGWNDTSRHLYPTEEGFGRTDAVGRIANTAFGDHIDPKNYHVANAPVSYPYVWNIWKFDWVQYTAFVTQPMARNVGETLGTGATYTLVDQYGRPIPAAERYRTSVLFDNLLRIESTLQQLKPPRWPEDLLGPIDQAKAERGRQLFQSLTCQGCHGPHVAVDAIKQRDAPLKRSAEPEWMIAAKDVRDIGTDPTAAMNAVNARVDLSRTGLELGAVRTLLADQLKRFQERSDVAIARLTRETAELQRQGAATRDRWTAHQAALDKAIHERPSDEDIQRRLDELDLRAVSIPDGLNILGLVIRDRYYADRRFTDQMRACYEGFDTLDLPQANLGYKPRPLEGVWATPPFLHNGSVPTLYDLLSPAYERPSRFFIGRREFDPLKVGFVTEPLSEGGFWLDTRQVGNANTGHEFRAGYVPYDEQHPQVQYGVIGPELTPAQRFEIIEYLKIHRDEPANAPSQAPPPCLPPGKGSG